MHWLARRLSVARRLTKPQRARWHPSTLELGGNDEMLICRRDIEA
jgi:hypothetical protein